MGSRRGFFAQLAYEQRMAEKRQAATARRAEQLRKKVARTDAAERKRIHKDARDAHVESMEAEAEEKNDALAEVYSDIDNLLSATLEVDDYVDLETLRAVAQHPPFQHTHLEAPTPSPAEIPEPAKPILVIPPAPKGLGLLFGKKKYAIKVAKAHEGHKSAVLAWESEVASLPARRQSAQDAHANAETTRVMKLESARAAYAKECADREAEVADRNKKLDQFIANLGYGVKEAIQEYVSIVLSNSVYPSHFRVSHEFEFEPSSAELILRVMLPGPKEIPDIKAYKFVKASGEIVTTPLSQKACRDRYESAVHQVALRTIHEIFEADRRALIKTVSLEVGADAVDPATGQQGYVPFVIVGAERELFKTFDLSAVVPELTLERLAAALSKNPYELVPAQRKGVRG